MRKRREYGSSGAKGFFFKAVVALYALSLCVIFPAAGSAAAPPRIAAGYDHAVAIQSDGTLWTWGANRYGQVGDGTTVDRLSPFLIGTGPEWKDIAAGKFYTLAIPTRERPVVFIGPYEHHSNEIPWRESIADVVVIAEDHDGQIDRDHLERELIAHRDRPLKIGSFSAASNVTGITSDTYGITELLHRHGALALWDFAAAAPYVGIEMNPPGRPEAAMDAVFISPHKFIGGPRTPGVLVVKRRLLTNRVPTVPGGGTVR